MGGGGVQSDNFSKLNFKSTNSGLKSDFSAL